MWELRWILLGMGVLLIAGVYAWSRKPFAISFRSSANEIERAEPSISEISATDPPDVRGAPGGTAAYPPRTQPQGTDKVVTLRFIGKEHTELSGEQAVVALREAGLVHGKYGIFHYLPEEESDQPLFSVANLTEPGSFNVTDFEDATIPGMSFFMVLPGPGDPVVCFDAMVQTARALTQELDAELFDERGSSWSIQRERFIREEIIEYRHQQTRA
jgi:cell division protein ZipA